ncbi:hypothetical protein [Parabacteroides sp. PF5-9]|uniref:hypothetical protein n=1 Tax=Parabacteroides sp. PF5-9 TaxID=1742404 RepID=UPI0024762438|nr:hypothetical protein [Parabacteroides sp. PF5-9]MDH6358497.1 hypothetical protein [Parabacteroides sp. PF5-9]
MKQISCVLTLRIFLVAAFLTTTLSAYTQEVNLTGSWVLEEATVLKITAPGNTIPVELSSAREKLYDALPDKLQFSGDMLTLSYSRMDIAGQYQVQEGKIECPFTAAPMSMVYTFVDGKLHLTQQVDYGFRQNGVLLWEKYQVVTIYKIER